ncbi:hypothetical protein GCM10012288_22050 [Malaciobacter pacificus]|uniref:Uncharacterized protein n=1 Tax=Malaciobacter pacificus TaxID=1080223 RepID=A0A5C2HED6_9BACT|nr:hypothetical protein [Malaciobacter pacificus]QEP34742.1 hypothetical protein APAC_1646 [Malaciobacter pacificus]GGD47419.1 hypothetical protein GCM10012288_22050 [Malaciobacter pacificus]
MDWTLVKFGQYRNIEGKKRNKTLPEILFHDADWFFWAYEQGALVRNGIPKDEVELMYYRARRIKPMKGCYVNHFLYYDDTSWGFSFISIEEAKKYHSDLIGGGTFDKDYNNWDSTYRTILQFIDLSFPRQQKEYDKKGCKEFANDLKDFLGIKRISRKSAEKFFSNEDNFI